MQKLYQFNPGDNAFDVHRGGKVFYSARVYHEEELRPHFNNAELQTQFEYLGEGPPDCDRIRTKSELAERVEALGDWINGPIARKLGWDHQAGPCGVRELAVPLISKLATAAARLGIGRPRPYLLELDEADALVVLNGIRQWAVGTVKIRPISLQEARNSPSPTPPLNADPADEHLHDAMKSSPSIASAKRLFALSGNRCSFPGCGRQILDPVTGDLQGAITHINGVSPGGPRYDPSQTDEQRECVENLILLCYSHHAEIDRNRDSCSVDFLRGMKAANEGHFQLGKEPSEAVATALLATVSENKITHGSAIVSEKQSGGQVANTIINVGPHAWGDSLPREDQLVFRPYDFCARHMGQDSYGGQCPAERVSAKWIQYSFRIEIFNTRSINVGLMDIFVVFAKDENALHRVVPGLDCGEIRAGTPHFPAVTSMNLPSNEWTRGVFHGTLWDAKMAAVQDCNEIFLVAKTVDRFEYRCPLGTVIEE